MRCIGNEIGILMSNPGLQQTALYVLTVACDVHSYATNSLHNALTHPNMAVRHSIRLQPPHQASNTQVAQGSRDGLSSGSSMLRPAMTQHQSPSGGECYRRSCDRHMRPKTLCFFGRLLCGHAKCETRSRLFHMVGLF
jgi:hypothetical protein